MTDEGNHFQSPPERLLRLPVMTRCCWWSWWGPCVCCRWICSYTQSKMCWPTHQTVS
ncbi:hypothetical protein DPMN_043664 [Dreissena polymorpha]|uniref:Uncharacterized protein n=1 Tax=Dreissena polymorpha TaxID=45954 RepID=A0A9D4D4F6_DREPO|nr:hypothetical protein DPMN_043664 [Dreissena polymorpha]